MRIVVYENYALSEVEVSDAPKESDRDEENAMHAMFALLETRDRLREYRLGAGDVSDVLLAVKLLVTAQYGRRREDVESEAMRRAFYHYGLDLR